jgi:hypothetical protein
MEDLVPAPPSSGLSLPRRVQTRDREPSSPGTLGTAVALVVAFTALGAVVACGLGMAGVLEGTALVLYAAQVAAGVIVVFGLAGRLVESFYEDGRR